MDFFEKVSRAKERLQTNDCLNAHFPCLLSVTLPKTCKDGVYYCKCLSGCKDILDSKFWLNNSVCKYLEARIVLDKVQVSELGSVAISVTAWDVTSVSAVVSMPRISQASPCVIPNGFLASSTFHSSSKACKWRHISELDILHWASVGLLIILPLKYALPFEYGSLCHIWLISLMWTCPWWAVRYRKFSNCRADLLDRWDWRQTPGRKANKLKRKRTIAETVALSIP